MGQTLSEPLTEKTSDEGQDSRVAFGVSAMQGWRISMEDAHATILDLRALIEESSAEDPDSSTVISYFGVYDGHGGDKVALFAGENVHKIVARQEAFKRKDFEQALKDGFLATDRAILSDPKYEEEVSGCTATVGLITHDKIYVANAGDSRSVLGIKGRAKPLSQDHKPTNESEKQRIQAAGGFVDFGRVNGNLALSRAIGDFEFKKTADLGPEQQIVTAFPDVTVHDITSDDEFLVLACDGIWDCMSSQSVIEFVRRGIAAKQELHKICENLMDNCLASNSDTGGVGCDNMTVVIVALLRGQSKADWYNMIAQRVADGDGPCAPPEYAEQRGPGNRRNFGDNSDDDFDMDSRTSGLGGRSGRIILLGDGTELLTSDDDYTELFANEEHETKHQIQPVDDSETDPDSGPRREREGTPAPEGKAQAQLDKVKQEAAHVDKPLEHQVKAVVDTAAPKQEEAPSQNQ